jgi:hypothetical protein
LRTLTLMKRLHAFEIHELSGCPDLVRRLATDYLHTVGEVFRAFEPVTPLLATALSQSGARQIVDLCSGGTGPVVSLAKAVEARLGYGPTVVLTDLFPNRAAFARAAERSAVPILAEPEPIDARHVPERLDGVRTVFDAFHHFRPEDARGILRDAAERRRPILIVEATERSVPALLGMLLFVPLLVLVLTPLVRPLSGWRLLLTYVLPLAPLLILFDGLVSCLRSYTETELRALTHGLETETYRFYIGRKATRGGRLTYVLGIDGALPEGALD